MFTRCPHCQTVYEPTAAQLAQGRGHLQCGVCDHEFDALEHLSEHPFAHGHAHGGHLPPRVEPAAMGVGVPAPVQGDIFEVPVATPAFAMAPAERRSGGLGWWAAVAVFGLLLLFQVLLAQRDALAADPMWRPLLLRSCAALGCKVVPWTAPQGIEVTARDVRPHPSVPGALLVQLSFRNGAEFDQVWPQLELAMLDLSGKPLALRRFSAAEYLGGEPSSSVLRAGQSAEVTLEIADPGKEAIAYAFDFR
ncbi:MAG: zinc-ribbon and DUF3426 domain-containing protein [Lysobacteraceae bacterium]|nr:zinc-ribbon and DUF3426 domain-containing protein [Xanthomonadales bacterium]HPF74529.1 zinc-ribbon and DUF3426 domain-containing protein [Xanthomonadaceae bacterium]HRY00257.1 zinc-ribbon and DUF3426 domain-containing protein [Xanthomonadaceae bacterium]